MRRSARATIAIGATLLSCLVQAGAAPAGAAEEVSTTTLRAINDPAGDVETSRGRTVGKRWRMSVDITHAKAWQAGDRAAYVRIRTRSAPPRQAEGRRFLEVYMAGERARDPDILIQFDDREGGRSMVYAYYPNEVVQCSGSIESTEGGQVMTARVPYACTWFETSSFVPSTLFLRDGDVKASDYRNASARLSWQS